MSRTSLTRFQQVDQDAFNYILDYGVREPAILAELRAETLPLPGAQMQIGPDQGQFMQMLVRIMDARHILELGTYTGYSSLAMAIGMNSRGRLITCDVDPHHTAIARRYWQKAGVEDRIELRLGPGLLTLDALFDDGLTGVFDLAFIDADKQNYSNYYEKCLTLLRPGGVILVDNVFMGARALKGTTQESNGKFVHDLNIKIQRDERVDVSTLGIGDGLTIARKK